MDYITRPFDPGVLRAKVAVFADLWRTTAELAAQVEAARVLEAESVALRAAVDDALAVLDAVPAEEGAVGAVGEAVTTARARLAQTRPNPRISIG